MRHRQTLRAAPPKRSKRFFAYMHPKWLCCHKPKVKARCCYPAAHVLLTLPANLQAQNLAAFFSSICDTHAGEHHLLAGIPPQGKFLSRTSLKLSGLWRALCALFLLFHRRRNLCAQDKVCCLDIHLTHLPYNKMCLGHPTCQYSHSPCPQALQTHRASFQARCLRGLLCRRVLRLRAAQAAA